jgi:hypothetical protein
LDFTSGDDGGHAYQVVGHDPVIGERGDKNFATEVVGNGKPKPGYEPYVFPALSH